MITVKETSDYIMYSQNITERMHYMYIARLLEHTFDHAFDFKQILNLLDLAKTNINISHKKYHNPTINRYLTIFGNY